MNDNCREGGGKGAVLRKSLLLLDAIPVAIRVQIMSLVGFAIQEVKEEDKAGELGNQNLVTALAGD